MNEYKQCYMHIEICNNLDELRESFSYWSNRNDDCVIVSHSTSLHGTNYLLSIAYHYIDD